MGLIKKCKKFYQVISSLSEINEMSIDYKIRSNQLLVDAITSTAPITAAVTCGSTELIVSLTSYDKRIHDVHLVIESIAQQTIKPNRLILWLDENEFTLNSIPLILHKQIARGLEVRFCPNYRSYKKLIPALKEFPKANIITIDDDILYPHDMVEILFREHTLCPNYIIGHRAHKMKFENGTLVPYSQWENESLDCTPSDLIFITTGGGTLFPAKCFVNEVFNSSVFMSICPDADDIWFKSMSLISNVKCKKVSDCRDFFSRFLLLQDSQDIALKHINLEGNDKQIKAVFEKYNLYRKLLP